LKRLTHGNTRILLIIMPNFKGHEDSIKDSRFKAAWQSGPTRTIRVPIALAEVTLEYARQLDRSNESRDTAKEPDNKTSVDIAESRDTAIISNKPSASAGSKNETLDTMLKQEVETVKTEREVNDANIEKQPDTELYPFIETVLTEVESLKLELQAVRAENQLLQIQLGNSSVEVETLNQELGEVREQLETERAEREENKKSAPAEKDLPEAADLLNKLKAKRKKSKTDLADLEAILELLEG
jgi:hypothetical protein